MPPTDDRAVLIGPDGTPNHAPFRVPSRIERVICEVQTATSVLNPNERAELALGFFLAAMETLGWNEARIVLEIRKAFAARGSQQ